MMATEKRFAERLTQMMDSEVRHYMENAATQAHFYTAIETTLAVAYEASKAGLISPICYAEIHAAYSATRAEGDAKPKKR